MSLLVSSPHVHGGDSIRANMLAVIFALLPAALVGVWLFGWLAVFLILLCIGACILTEMICLKLMGRTMTILGDSSAALTGLLLALILPPGLPWWMVLLACVVAIALSKQIYGGLGYNPFNPALAARVVLLISFPVQMTAWVIPMHTGVPSMNLYDFSSCWHLFWGGVAIIPQGLDAITMASPLGYVKTEWTQGIGVAEALQSYHYSYIHALLGSEAGSLGETSALALLSGGAYLLIKRVISWHIPVAYIMTVAVLALIFHQVNQAHFAPPMFHVLAGGLILNAFFMATDPVTSPVTPMGKLVFGIGCGVLTWSIRSFGSYPEGAMFSVLLMNCVTPLLDQYLRPRVYGKGRNHD